MSDAAGDAMPEINLRDVYRFRLAANCAWARGDWRHAAKLMERAEAGERYALEQAYNLPPSPECDDDMPF